MTFCMFAVTQLNALQDRRKRSNNFQQCAAVDFTHFIVWILTTAVHQLTLKLRGDDTKSRSRAIVSTRLEKAVTTDLCSLV